MDDIDKALDMAKDHTLIYDGDFTAEIILSTDGKNTVITRANTSEGRKKAWAFSQSIYDLMRERWGTKQSLNVQTYDKPKTTPKQTQTAKTWTGSSCEICGTAKVLSKNNKLYCPNKCWLKNQPE